MGLTQYNQARRCHVERSETSQCVAMFFDEMLHFVQHDNGFHGSTWETIVMLNGVKHLAEDHRVQCIA